MAQASQSVDEQFGEISSSKFRILRPLGSGGMGAVFEAEHLLTKRTGALKLLHRHFADVEEVVERFTREASAAGRINNPHIVETFDAGRLESGQPYIFMELLSGEALDARIELFGTLAFDEAIAICTQAAIGLVAAHRSGIIHRDIKPANLFLVAGATTLVKVLDFGISKFGTNEEVRRVTQEGTALGTPHYMPVEQVMGRDVDERVDVYALGVVLYEIVTGQPPYVADTLLALSIRIHEGRYTPVSQLRADTPPGFDEVMSRCLAVDRADRYPRMADLLSALLKLGGRNAESMAPTLAGASMPPPRGHGLTAAASVPLQNQPTARPRDHARGVGRRNVALGAAGVGVVLAVGYWGLRAERVGDGARLAAPDVVATAPALPALSAALPDEGLAQRAPAAPGQGALAAPSQQPAGSSGHSAAAVSAQSNPSVSPLAAKSASVHAESPGVTTAPAVNPRSRGATEPGGLKRDNPFD